jgi:hypothetical protein
MPTAFVGSGCKIPMEYNNDSPHCQNSNENNRSLTGYQTSAMACFCALRDARYYAKHAQFAGQFIKIEWTIVT